MSKGSSKASASYLATVAFIRRTRRGEHDDMERGLKRDLSLIEDYEKSRNFLRIDKKIALLYKLYIKRPRGGEGD